MVQSIAKNLSFHDLLQLDLVSLTVHRFLNNDFWRIKVIYDFPTRIPTSINKLYKSIYRSLYRKSRIFTLAETPSGTEWGMTEDEKSEEALTDITQGVIQFVIPRNPNSQLVRGDVIFLGWESGYRNIGKLMWNGEKVIELDYDLDDYGNVPSCMQFPEFPPDHFTDSIAHNEIFCLSLDSQKELQNNFDSDTQLSSISDNYRTYPVKIITDADPVTIKFSSLPLITNARYQEPYVSYGGVKIEECIEIYPHISCGSWNHQGSKGSKYEITDKWRPHVMSIEVDPDYKLEWTDDKCFKAIYNPNTPIYQPVNL